MLQILVFYKLISSQNHPTSCGNLVTYFRRRNRRLLQIDKFDLLEFSQRPVFSDKSLNRHSRIDQLIDQRSIIDDMTSNGHRRRYAVLGQFSDGKDSFGN